MYYIISPIKIEELQKLSFEELAKINPIKILKKETRSKVKDFIIFDFIKLSTSYNCLLYLYVIQDRWYEKNMKMGTGVENFSSWVRCYNGYDKSIAREDGYFNCNILRIKNEIYNLFENINLQKQNLFIFYLTVENGFECIF